MKKNITLRVKKNLSVRELRMEIERQLHVMYIRHLNRQGKRMYPKNNAADDMILAKVAAGCGLVNDDDEDADSDSRESVMVLDAAAAGCTDTRDVFPVVNGVRSSFPLEVNFDLLTQDEIDTFITCRVGGYDVEDGNIGALEELLKARASDELDALTDSVPADYQLKDEPEADNFWEFLCMIEQSDRVLKQINSTKVSWTDKFGKVEEGLTRSLVWADVERNKWYARKVSDVAQWKVPCAKVFLSDAMYTKYRKMWVHAYEMAQTKTTKEKPRLLRRAKDVTAAEKAARKPLWDTYNLIQSCIQQMAEGDETLWSAYYTEKNTEINPYFTCGDSEDVDEFLLVTRQPKVVTYMLHMDVESTQILDEVTFLDNTSLIDELAEAHIKEMAAAGYLDYDQYPKARKEDEVKPRGGNFRKCRHLDPVAFAKGEIVEKWQSTGYENDEADYAASLMVCDLF